MPPMWTDQNRSGSFARPRPADKAADKAAAADATGTWTGIGAVAGIPAATGGWLGRGHLRQE